MDGMHYQLDEEQNEGENLGDESKVKTEFSDVLREFRVEQLAEKQEECLELDKLAAMSEEICDLRKLHGELQSSFQRKDLLLDQISSKFLKSEGDKRDLVASLDEAFARIHDLEKKAASASEEMSGLKRLLSIKLQLNLETQKNAIDHDERDGCILKREEESIVSQDQLIWRNEQFSHLVEAHNKLQVLFEESKSEWQKERSSLLSEISSLQAALDAKVRASDKSEEELRRNKALLDESEGCRSHLQQLHETENTQAENIRNDAERVKFELQSKTSEIETLKLKLQKSESEVGVVKLNLEENARAHEQEKASLSVTLNHKDAKILNLEHQLSMLKSVILAKSDAAEVLIQEKDNYIRLAEDRNCSIKRLQNEIALLMKKLAEREGTNIALTYADEISSSKAKGRGTQELLKEYPNSCRATISLVEDGDPKEAESQVTLEVEERNWVLANKEKNINTSHEKVELQDESLLQPMQVASQPEETKKLEIHELTSQLEKETRCFDSLLEELESHKHALLEDRTKERIKRGNLLPQLENMCQLIGSLCSEDAELMGMLGKLSPLHEEEHAMKLFSGDGLSNFFSPSRKPVQMRFDERAPLTELNVT